MPIAKWIPRRGAYVDQYLYTTDYSQVIKQYLIDNKLIRETMMLSAVSLHWPPSVYTQPE